MTTRDQSPTRQTVCFAVVALGVYIVMMAPWPGVEKGYAAVFRVIGNAVGSPLATMWGGKAEVIALDEADSDNDTLARIGNLSNRMARKATLSSRYMGYTSVALTVALVVGTPLPWRRRMYALLWGVLLIHVFIALRLLAKFMYLGNLEPVHLFQWSPWSWAVIRVAHHLLVTVSEAKFVGPVFVWLIVAVRRDVWPLAGFATRWEASHRSQPVASGATGRIR